MLKLRNNSVFLNDDDDDDDDKGKVVSVLFLTEHHAMKTYWEVEVQLHSFFDLDTRW
jgi:hypothetical protein